ncbi:hypothetical protein [Lysobacter gummosus]|uniref:hypothetical protein n=1 Tax=Lysobacter gummosus TaxID=262324 RepID=UPI003632D383
MQRRAGGGGMRGDRFRPGAGLIRRASIDLYRSTREPARGGLSACRRTTCWRCPSGSCVSLPRSDPAFPRRRRPA